MYCKSVSWWIGEPHLRILCPPEKYLMHQSAFYQRGRLWSCSNVSSRLERSNLKFILIYWQLLCLLAIDTKFLNFRASTLTHSKGYMTISVEEGKQAKCRLKATVQSNAQECPVVHLLNMSLNIVYCVQSSWRKERLNLVVKQWLVTMHLTNEITGQVACQNLLTFFWMQLVHSAWVHHVSLCDFGNNEGNPHWRLSCKTSYTCDAERVASIGTYMHCVKGKQNLEFTRALEIYIRDMVSTIETTLILQLGSSLLPFSEHWNCLFLQWGSTAQDIKSVSKPWIYIVIYPLLGTVSVPNIWFVFFVCLFV